MDALNAPSYNPLIPDQAQPIAPGTSLMRHTLRLGSNVLACATYLDMLREAFSHGSMRAFPGLSQTYAMAVAAYAAASEGEKWNDPRELPSHKGQWWMVAWFLLPIVLWLAGVTNVAQPFWPPELVSTIAWIVAAYSGTKVSARWRSYNRGLIATARANPAPADALTPDQLVTRHVLRFGSVALGAVCWMDAALEGLSAGEWRFNPGLYLCYSLVLAGYAATREWEKWTDPLDQDGYWGSAFVGAWFGLPVLFAAAHMTGRWVVLPGNYIATVGTVLGVLAGTSYSKAKRLRGTGAGSPGEAVAKACEARTGTFTSEDIAADTKLPFEVVRGHIGNLVGMGVVAKEGNGRYRWVGKAKK